MSEKDEDKEKCICFGCTNKALPNALYCQDHKDTGCGLRRTVAAVLIDIGPGAIAGSVIDGLIDKD